MRISFFVFTRYLLLLLFIPAGVMAQHTDDVILRAMKDELKRNMDELVMEGHNKPFFISYQVTDGTEINITASLGALLRSSEFPSRSKNVRVMVGDYDFNDESLDPDGGNGNADGVDIAIPVDSDYAGIRRALWSSTDEVYRSAAKTYKSNLEFIKKQKKELKDIPHRSFARAPVTNLIVKGPSYTVDRPALENLARELSALFRAYGDIHASSVFVGNSHGYSYFTNSEGFVVKTPIDMTTITVNAQTRSAEGEFIFDQLTYHALTPDKLPSSKMIQADIQKMTTRLLDLRNTEAYEDSYTGPVLFVGYAAADIFSNTLLSYGEGLMASKNITNNNNASEMRIGKKIIADGFTVKSTPKLKQFNNTDLLGAFDVDDEGVVPPDELVLVENGILKNQMNDRTVTKTGQQPNGHGSGPGVIAVSYKGGLPVEKLKTQLIEKAKEDGLGYAIIVRHIFSGDMRSKNTYKVSLEDGSETMIRSANVKSVNLKSLKKILGVSNGQIVQNSGNRSGGTLSIIAPDAILLEDIEVDGHRANPYIDKEVYVENPLKKN